MYLIAPGQKQYNSEAFFFIALVEIFRRFIWNFFRVENEHMTNMGHFSAKRDVPLPLSSNVTHLEEYAKQPEQPRREVGPVKRWLARVTDSVKVIHAEDFDRNPNKKESERKGNLPDDVEGFGDTEQGKTKPETGFDIFALLDVKLIYCSRGAACSSTWLPAQNTNKRSIKTSS